MRAPIDSVEWRIAYTALAVALIGENLLRLDRNLKSCVWVVSPGGTRLGGRHGRFFFRGFCGSGS